MRKTDWIILALAVIIAAGALFVANRVAPCKAISEPTYTIGEAEINQ